MTKRVLLALVVGIALGIVIAQSGSSQLSAIARAVEPVGALWINAIRMTVIPLVAASLIAALASASDAKLVGRVGGMAIVLFLAMLAATAAITVLVAPPLLAKLSLDPAATAGLLQSARDSGAAVTSTKLPTFTDWILGLVPTNPIRAAVDGVMLSLIVAAVAIGAASTRTSEASRRTLAGFFGGVADAMLRLMQWILLLSPIGVFALALPLATRLGAAAAGAVAYYILLVSLLCIFIGLLLYPAVALFSRVSIRAFAQGCAQAQAVAMTSRSSLASLPAMIAGAEKRIGLDPALTRFFLPLAASMFRIGAVIGQTVGVLFLARLYGVDVSTATLLTVAVTSILTSFSVPGIAGGSILVMVPVLLAAGIPVEGVGILLGVDAIPDIFRTSVNVTGHMAGATIISRHVAPSAIPSNTVAAAR